MFTKYNFSHLQATVFLINSLINLTLGYSSPKKWFSSDSKKQADIDMILPVGSDNFGKIFEKKLNFVDKSLLIKDLFDDVGTDTVVIIRPRRFGKTLNLSMLHHFLSQNVSGFETKDLFNGLKISQYPDYMKHQGKYPVVSISFKDIKQLSFEDAYSKLYELIIETYNQHHYLESSTKLTKSEKELYEITVGRKATQGQLENSLKFLTGCLFAHHGVRPWLLIDEYDTPIQIGYSKGYYDQIIGLMRGLFGAALKSNIYLEKSIVTGILRIAKESLFSGVNNLEVYSLLRSEYSQHFGFTENEVDEILVKSGLQKKSEEIKQWYNGYQIGKTTVYNPWSIANCVKRLGEIEPYWVNTSDNQLIKDLLKGAPLDFKKDFESLIHGDTVEKLIDEQMAFQYLSNNPESTWSLLLMAGYLKPVSSRKTDQGNFVKLSVPNREVRNLYRQIVEQWLSNGHGVEWYNVFIDSLLNGRIEEFKRHLDKVLSQIVSCHDVAKEPEAFFHGLLLGFIASLQQNYEIKSNRESGLGRFDIMLIPKDNTKNESAVVMELKVKRENETLEETAEKALHQIEQKKYTEEFKQRGIEKFIELGIGFEGKGCVVKDRLSGFLVQKPRLS